MEERTVTGPVTGRWIRTPSGTASVMIIACSKIMRGIDLSRYGQCLNGQVADSADLPSMASNVTNKGYKNLQNNKKQTEHAFVWLVDAEYPNLNR